MTKEQYNLLVALGNGLLEIQFSSQVEMNLPDLLKVGGLVALKTTRPERAELLAALDKKDDNAKNLMETFRLAVEMGMLKKESERTPTPHNQELASIHEELLDDAKISIEDISTTC